MARKAARAKKKRRPGRSKGSKNLHRQRVSLNPELQRIQGMLQAFLARIPGAVRIAYLALDGHFGHYPTVWVARQDNLYLIPKLRRDAALYEPFQGQQPRHGPHRKYGQKVGVHHMPEKDLKSNQTEDAGRTLI